jgi:hypothetical protein
VKRTTQTLVLTDPRTGRNITTRNQRLLHPVGEICYHIHKQHNKYFAVHRTDVFLNFCYISLRYIFFIRTLF